MNDITAHAQLLAQMKAHVTNGSAPYLVIPSGCEVIDLEHLLPHPIRKRGIFETSDDDSFAAYVFRYKNPGSVIFVKKDVAIAVFDYHRKEESGTGVSLQDQAGWAEHIAIYRGSNAIDTALSFEPSVPVFKGSLTNLEFPNDPKITTTKEEKQCSQK